MSLGAADLVTRALAELRGGRQVLVVDDEDRENEGDLIMAAEMATPEALAFYDSAHHGPDLRGRHRRSVPRSSGPLPLMVSPRRRPSRHRFHGLGRPQRGYFDRCVGLRPRLDH